MTKSELADMLRVSVRTITAYMGKGLLPQPVQLGRKLLWDEAVVHKFIQPKPAFAKLVIPAKQGRGRPRKALN